MTFDTYEAPGSEQLLRSGQERRNDDGYSRQVLLTEVGGALLFVAVAVPLAVFSSSTRSLSPVVLAISAGAYLCAARVTFPVGSAWTQPTQLVFVPMLFVLPTTAVPLVVAACSLLTLWSPALQGRLSLTRVAGRVGDSFYALGPAVVIVLAHQQHFAWKHWPVLAFALAAQFAFDTGSGFARTWFAERVPPSQQADMAWLYLTDAALSCTGILIAAAAVQHRGLILMSLPLISLLWLFARERQERLDAILELSTAYRGTTLLLGDIVEADDGYTGMHSRDVVDLSLAVSDALGLDPTRRRTVEFSALLHDVGKIRIPKEVINKPGSLNEDEWALIRRHTIEGEAMLRQLGGKLASLGRVVRSSHERWDGTGYPDGLRGLEIPIEARIISACDAYSAMTTDRPYRPALEAEDALAELRGAAGSQFDPDVVAALEGLLRAELAASERLARPHPVARGTPIHC
jgi:HD-GYP domain-containing protein (c-di-GMP phosphodiesterase class II)